MRIELADRKAKWLFIEAILAFLVCVLLLIYTVPKFLNNQGLSKEELAIEHTKRLRDILAHSPHLFQNFGKYTGTVFTAYNTPIRRRDGSQVNVISRYECATLNLRTLSHDFDTLDFTDWNNDELVIELERVYSRMPVDSKELDQGYPDKPFFFGLRVFIRDEESKKSPHKTYITDVGPDGHYQMVGWDDTFDVSNGLDSSGQVFIDSEEIWGLPKAVILKDSELPE